MMISQETYLNEIKNCSYAELIAEEKRLFKHIIELQYKIVLEDIRLEQEFISPSYKTQLESNRHYLIVLQNFILEKECEIQKLEFKDALQDAFSRKEY